MPLEAVEGNAVEVRLQECKEGRDEWPEETVEKAMTCGRQLALPFDVPLNLSRFSKQELRVVE
jgi:hypothetical protein